MRLKDIAEEAGASVSTVSRVLNGKDLHAAGSELRERIIQIANREQYQKNAAAQALRSGSAYAGCPLRNIACIFARTLSRDPFFMQMSRSAVEYLLNHNCIVKYSLSLQELSSESILDILSEGSLDGVIILGRCEKELMHNIHSIVEHLVYVSLNKRDIPYDQIYCDAFDASRSAIEQLYALGHRNIGYLGEVSNEIRYKAYEAFRAENRRIAADPKYVTDVVLSTENGYTGMRQLIHQAPDVTAVFCANDTTAMGALRACKDLGLHVPLDISIIGMDDLDSSQYLSPRLSTIHIPIHEMGSMAANILLDHIEGGHSIPATVSFPSHVILRESCSNPRKII